MKLFTTKSKICLNVAEMRNGVLSRMCVSDALADYHENIAVRGNSKLFGVEEEELESYWTRLQSGLQIFREPVNCHVVRSEHHPSSTTG